MRHSCWVDPAAVSTEKRPAAARGLLLLADISGYTAFLQDVALAHRDDAFADGAVPDAYAVISSLLDGIVGRVVPPFRLSKLEGDAVFAYAREADSMPRGRAMLDCLLELPRRVEWGVRPVRPLLEGGRELEVVALLA